MQILGINAIKGGAGSTTLVANITAALAQHGNTVLAIDLCADNALGRCLGVLPQHSGWLTAYHQQRSLGEAAWKIDDNVYCIPHGPLTNAKPTFPTDWLAQQLAQLTLPDDAWIVFDLPNYHSPLKYQAMRLAQLTLLITTSEPLAANLLLEHLITQTPAVSAHAIPQGDQRTTLPYILINQFNPSRQLDNDVSLVLRDRLPQYLIPLTVHYDEALREALANQCSVMELAENSQAATDITRLTAWLTVQLAHQRQEVLNAATMG